MVAGEGRGRAAFGTMAVPVPPPPTLRMTQHTHPPLLTSQKSHPAREGVAAAAVMQCLLLDEFCNTCVGRGKGEGLVVGVLVDFHSSELPVATIVPVSVARVEMPRINFEVGWVSRYLLARRGRHTQDARRLSHVFWIFGKAEHAMMAVSDALAEGVGAGAGRGMLRCEVPLELRTVETVAAAIGQGTAPGIKLPRKPPLGAEDAVSAIADRSGEGAFAPEARRGSQRNQAQSGGGDVERVCQVRCGEDVAQGGGEDGHGD